MCEMEVKLENRHSHQTTQIKQGINIDHLKAVLSWNTQHRHWEHFEAGHSVGWKRGSLFLVFFEKKLNALK